MPDLNTDVNHTDHALLKDPLLEAQVAEYTQLLNSSERWRLSFPPKIEQTYQQFIKKDFIETNKFTVCFGVLFYTSFLLIDYFYYEDLKAEVLILRILIAIFASVFLSAIFFKQSVKHVLSSTLFCAILMGLQVVGSAMFFFEQPYNLLYAIGVLPIIVFGILVFRFSFKHTLTLVMTLFSAYFIHVLLSYPYRPDSGSLQDVLNIASPMMVVFIAAISLMGLYMSYAVDKLNRSDWLKNNIMRIESAQLTNLTNQLETLSTTDSLTGLHNRRYFDEKLQKYWQKSQEHETPLSIMMLDLDWFKPYNDHYGHQQGDACLQRISRCFQETSEPHKSVVARYGGEEFIIIMPNTTPSDAHALANQICHNTHALNIPHVASPLGLCSVSIGVHTAYPATQNDLKGVDKFLQEVDMALYQAKENGKNRVSVYSASA